MSRLVIPALVVFPLFGSSARAQCPDPGWQGGFGAPGVSSNQFTPQVNAMHVWDPDGSGGPDAPVRCRPHPVRVED